MVIFHVYRWDMGGIPRKRVELVSIFQRKRWKLGTCTVKKDGYMVIFQG